MMMNKDFVLKKYNFFMILLDDEIILRLVGIVLILNLWFELIV